MTVLKNIIDKKKTGKIKVETKKVFHSELLNEDITLTKKPLSMFLDILSKHGVDVGNLDQVDFSSLVPLMNELIFHFAEMFRNPDDVKAAVEYYEVATPMDLPEMVFEGNIDELSGIFMLIVEFYFGDLEEVRDDIKN